MQCKLVVMHDTYELYSILGKRFRVYYISEHKNEEAVVLRCNGTDNNNYNSTVKLL